MKKLSIVVAVAGLILGTLLVGWTGFGAVGSAIFSVGIGGFALFCALQLATMVVLGAAWRIVAPITGTWRIAIFAWGRMVRDSAASCLPFSAVGGFVLGVRAVTLQGVPPTSATLSMVVDLTAEFLAELIFAMAALVVLLTRSADASLHRPILIGLAVALVAVAVIMRAQQGIIPLLVSFGRKIIADWFSTPGRQEPISGDELAKTYGRSGRMTSGTAAHLVGWLCKGVGNWLAFRLLGSDLDLMGGLAIEALLHVLLIPAFIVPGYAGIQEAGYAGIGALFGIPPEISLSVSLLRRARDIALGIPILLIWQAVEVRSLRRPKALPGADGRSGDGAATRSATP